jgi:class 3 adenylate cyclase
MGDPASLRVFLCHSSSDKAAVRVLFNRLFNHGIDPWFDDKQLLPGQDWEAEIRKAVYDSHVVLVCLSRSSTTKEGFVQKEIKLALEVAEEKPDGTIFIIPGRLEECVVPERLKKMHWVNLFEPEGFERLLSALYKRASDLGIEVLPKRAYSPKPIDNSTVELSPGLNELIDTLARNNHDLWAKGRLEEGWRYSRRRDGDKHETPLLVPYDELPESEKEYDRQNAVETLKSIVHFGGNVEAAPAAGRPSGSASPALKTWVPGRIPSLTYEEYSTLGKQANDKGQSLLAVDIADEALSLWRQDSGLLQIKALALARMGSPEQARALLADLTAEAEDDEETAGILAQTFKDLWLRTGDAQDLRKAVESYLVAYSKRHDHYWIGINAATLSWAVGDAGKSVELATEISRVCLDQFPKAAAEKKYWLMAAIAEAALIVAASRNPDGSGSDWQEAERLYGEARELAADNFGHLFSTWRNAGIVLRQVPQIVGERIERALGVPRVAVFAGHRIDPGGRAAAEFPAEIAPRIKAAIREHLVRLNIGVGFSTVASVSDILFLEALQELGGKTHIVLPCNREQLIEESLAASGADWVERFKTVISRAEETIVASDDRLILGGVVFRYADDVVDGLATMRAAQYGTGLLHMALWNGLAGDGPDGTHDSVLRWKARGYKVDVVSPREAANGKPNPIQEIALSPALACSFESESIDAAVGVTPEIRAIMFADVKRFSQLNEQQLPGFLRDFMGPVAALVRRTSPAPLLQNTWGDGLFFVFAGAGEAARFALRLRDCVAAIDRKASGLPADLSLRIGLHCGPVFRFQDQLTAKPGFLGSHVNRTARLEAVTPAGRIYATDLFAALATLDAPGQFRFDYVGKVPLARNFGRFSLYDVSQS